MHFRTILLKALVNLMFNDNYSYSTSSATFMMRKKVIAMSLKHAEDLRVCLAPAEMAFSGLGTSSGAVGIPGSWYSRSF